MQPYSLNKIQLSMKTVRKFKSVLTLIALVAMSLNGFAQEAKTVVQIFRKGSAMVELPLTSIDNVTFDQGASGYALILLKKDGMTVNVPLNVIQQLTFLSDYLLIKRSNGVSEAYAFNDVQKLFFEKVGGSPPTTTYAVTVINGTADAIAFEAGKTVSITSTPPPEGFHFKNWSANPSVIFANANSPATIFTMPAAAVVVIGSYELSNTGNLNASSSNDPKIWIDNNETLHVSGVKTGTVSVYSILGSLIARKNVNIEEEVSISLQNVDPGLFILRVESPHGSIVKKFIKR